MASWMENEDVNVQHNIYRWYCDSGFNVSPCHWLMAAASMAFVYLNWLKKKKIIPIQSSIDLPALMPDLKQLWDEEQRS